MMQFDTRKVFKQLQDAGLKDNAADAIVNAINEARSVDLDHLATKQDLAEVKLELKEDIHKLEIRLTNEMTDLKIQVHDIGNNIAMIKWFALGILFPVIAATFQFLILPMFK